MPTLPLPKIIVIFVTVLICAIIVISCSKNTDPDLKNHRVKLLVDKKWQLIKYEEDQPANNPNGEPPHSEELYSFDDSSLNDDYEIYYSNLSYEWNDNVILRDDGVPKITGNWSMTEDGNKLLVQWNFFPDAGERMISILNDSLLVLLSVNKVAPQTITYTYKLSQ